jgi:L-lysine 2,3-aminomutase
MDREGFRRKKESWASRVTVVAFARADWENYDKKIRMIVVTDEIQTRHLSSTNLK